jgi:TonB family protein
MDVKCRDSWEQVVFEFPKRRSLRPNAALFASFLAHAAVLFFLLHRQPIFVKPSSIAWGRQSTAGTLIYAPPRLELASNQHPKLQLNRKPKPAPAPPAPAESARAGSQNGSMFSGPAKGIEATPAIPLAFPDPEIYPWQLSGVQGDVVVEVTIDEKGGVSDTRLLQSVKRDIDEKCIATLRNWRFRSAMVDGMAIASRQDVHFHFPS